MLKSRRRAEQLIDSLKSEIAELREENARLRTDEQRALDPHAVAAELHDLGLAASLRGGSGAQPTSDDDRQAMLDLHLVHQGLIEVCTRLQVLSGQLHRQLTEGTPAPEMDRRVADLDPGYDRRRADRRAGTAGAPNGDPIRPSANGKAGNGRPGRTKVQKASASNGNARNGKANGNGRNGARRGGKPKGAAPSDPIPNRRLNWGGSGPQSAAAIRRTNRNRRGHP